MSYEVQAPKPTDQKALEWVLPINRSGWAIAAGYVGLLTIPILVAGPVAVALGIIALFDLKKHPTKSGRGRAWFAIIYGAIGTALLLLMLLSLILSFVMS